MRLVGWVLCSYWSDCTGATPVRADVLPGETVEERAVNGAKEYIKKNNLKNPSLTMLMMARFKNARLDQAVGRVDRGENEIR